MIILKDTGFNERSLYHKDINFGGKAKGLITMRNFGLRVPEFSVVTEIEGNEDIKDIENLLYDEIRKGNIDADRLYSVRSSASVEDSLTHSFAGIFETYLDVSIQDVPEKILECVRSMKSRRVETYLLENHIPDDELKMHVIIQEMIHPEQSGVLFTANPNGIVSESVIVIGEGSGDNVVMGRVPTTTTYFSNLEEVFYTEKQDGGPKVIRSHVEELRETGLLMQMEMGYPCDIEFAIKGGTIYYLQLRPVTTLDRKMKVILDNSNLIESYPGICLPLTDSFVREAYGTVFTGLVKAAVKNPLEVEPFMDRLNSMVTSSTGRMYYKINNWYYFLSFLPFHRKVIRIWQENMGIKEKEFSDIKDESSIMTRLKARTNIIRELLKNKENMEKLNSDFDKVRAYYEEEILKVRDNEDIKRLYGEIKEKVMDRWYVTLVNDIHTFVYTYLASRGITGKKKDADNRTLDGVRQLESLKPLQILREIAHELPQDINITTTREADDFLSQENETAWKINDFINEYGDRISGELKLETRTYRTNPELLFRRLKELRSMEMPRTDDAVPSKEGGVFLKRAAEGIRFREISRLNRTRLYGMVREMFLLMAYNLKKNGRIKSLDDIFYLTKDEIFKEKEIDSLERIVEERKRKYRAFENIPTYNRIEFQGEEFDRMVTNVADLDISKEEPDVLKGQGSSRGRVTGIVVRVDDPEAFTGSVKDRILVCSHTDPGWIYLISQCSGLIVEMGSLLSHSAIITRELGKPSVVGVKNATRYLKDGDLVEMDGETGIIEKIRQE